MNRYAERLTQHSASSLADFVVSRGADPARATAASIGPFYGSNSTVETVTGLFSRAVVLVEGNSEALALPVLLAMLGFDALKEGFAFVPVGGVANIAKWFRLFAAFGIPAYVVLDTDSDKQGPQATERLKSRQDLMKAMALEPFHADVNSVMAALVVQDRYAYLDANFDIALPRIFPKRWAALASEATRTVGESKPLQARYAAERVQKCDLESKSLVAFTLLIAKLRGLVAEQPGKLRPARPVLVPVPSPPPDNDEPPF